MEVEKKDSDEEPMEMVVEKMTDDPEAEVVEKHEGVVLTDKMAEDLKPMDTDKENLAESKSPEEIIQEDSGSDIAPMQTDEQVKQVQETFLSFLLPSWNKYTNWSLQNLCWFPFLKCRS